MQPLSAPLAVLLPLAGAGVILALAYRSFRIRDALNLLELLMVSIASAVTVLVLSLAAVHLFVSPPITNSQGLPFVASFLVYVLVLALLARQQQLRPAPAAVAGAIGLAPLWAAAFGSALLVICSFGECI